MTAHLELDRLPHVITTVLDAMPTGQHWWSVFADEPGLAMDRRDDGTLVVLHRGFVVFTCTAGALTPAGGTATFNVDGRSRTVRIVWSQPPQH